jgi:hypothetical protein
LCFQVATHLAHPRRFDPCKLSAIAGTRALRAQDPRDGTYAFPCKHAAFLTRAAIPANLAVFARGALRPQRALRARMVGGDGRQRHQSYLSGRRWVLGVECLPAHACDGLLGHIAASLVLTPILASRMVTLDLCSRRVGDSSLRKKIWHVNARDADPVVCHPIINVEAVPRAKIVSPVDARGKYNVSDDPPALQR